MGSYRIWVNNLNNYFNKVDNLEIKSEILTSDKDIGDYDIIICDKNSVDLAVGIKKSFPDKKVGVINLSADKKDIPIDFIIVGSLEEKDSLSHYDNVFLFPLIEDMYQNAECKKHSEKESLRIGFHGHYPHLSKFEPHLKNALEKIDKICNIELFIITSNFSFDWCVGKPNIKSITMKRWNLSTVKEDLLSCDIGISPNVTHIPVDIKKYNTSVELGLYNTDHILRMKNKSNAGRAFVFHQLGIPVVADFTPSNFHIMGDPKCGFIAHNQKSWERAILELREPERRQQIANNAKNEFDRLYNPVTWARRLFLNIRRL